MKTWNAKPNEIERKWWIVDATGKTLGRLSTEIAQTLRGKNKPQYTPHVDTGDFVVVINSEKIKVNGKKAEQKTYFRHTGYFGGIKETSYKEMLEKNPDRIITKAVEGMLPKNILSSQIIKKLKVYAGSEHPHAAQKPELLTLKES
ncbi:MAG: 50S ribosomal protein L13 [Bdellovibrionales bacterium]